MSTTIAAESTIAASPERVWAILTDFAAYPAWNPLITAISGTLQARSKLAIRVVSSNGGAMAFAPVITELRPAEVLEWLGHLVVPGIFDGRHRFELTRLPDGSTKFRQSETFSGFLIPFMPAVLKDTDRGFAAANAALKARSEAA